MKIIKSIKDAMKFCKPFIQLSDNTTSVPILQTAFVPPDTEGPWEMSERALITTLNYLFDKLHHSCYLLCSNGKTSTLVKLESTTISQDFKIVLESELASIAENSTITEKQRKTIRDFITDKEGGISNKLRILQCIVKKIKGDATTSSEYETFFQKMVLPQGVYVMNLTDANILRRDGAYPFPIYRKNKMPELEPEYRDALFLPIFSLSGNVQYHDIPIPNYDDVSYILGKASYNIADFETEWSKKTIGKAVFRGGPSGCGYTIQTNQRIKLATMKNSNLDVGIVGDKNTIDSNSIRFDPIHGLGMMNTGIRPIERLGYVEQSRYKYIIHVDGNVNAYRLLSIMATGSLILRVKSAYTSWFDHLLTPGEDYIEVEADLSDLAKRLLWCKMHDKECQAIAERSCEFARMALTAEYMREAFQSSVSSIIYADSTIGPIGSVEGSPIGPNRQVSSPIGPNRQVSSPIGPNREISSPIGPNRQVSSPIGPNREISSPIRPIEKVLKKTNPKKTKKYIDEILNSPEYYIKKNIKERCKKGFAPDKKDKTRCIKKTSDQTSATKKKHVSIEEIQEMMEKRKKCVEKYRIKYRKMQTKKVPKEKVSKVIKVPKEKAIKAPLVSEPPKEESSIISSISNLVKGVL